MLSLFMTGCGNENSSSNNDIKDTEVEKTTEIKTEATKPYNEFSDITIKGVTKINNSDNGFGVIFTSSTEKNIKDIELYYALYDTNMMLVGNTYKTCKFESANIVKDKDKVYVIGTRQATYSYVDVIIGEITFEDGTTWKIDNTDAWLKDITENKEEYKLKMNNMEKMYGEYANQAEKNAEAYNIQIDTEIVKSESKGYDVNLIITNNSDKVIKELVIKAALYQGKSAYELTNFSQLSKIYAPDKDKAKYKNYCNFYLSETDGIIEPGETKVVNDPQVFRTDNITIKTILYSVLYDSEGEYVDGTTAWSAYNSYYRE